MSKSHNPMELLDRYLQAVRFWLPKTQPQEDLIAELGEDLRSQIETRESELGHPLDEAEVSAILKRCGSPMVVAGTLGPKQQLIGPTLFPIYKFVLKIVLLWILIPLYLFIIGPINFANTGHWGRTVLITFGAMWSGMFIAAGIITLVFAVLERTHAQMGMEQKWDPRTLPPLVKPERKPSLMQSVSELVFACFALIWLLLLPQFPVLILGPAAAYLQAAPMWHSFYLPVVLLTVATVIRPAVMLARPQWDWFALSSQLVITVFSIVVLNFVLNAAGQTPTGIWQPFVVLADSVPHSAHNISVAAIVNITVLITIAIWWLVAFITGIVQIWQLWRYLRKRGSSSQTVSLRAH